MRLRARLLYIFLVLILNGQSNIIGFDIGSFLTILLFWMYAIPYLSRVSRLDYLHAKLVSLFKPTKTDNETNPPKDEKNSASKDISLEEVKKDNKENDSANDKSEIDKSVEELSKVAQPLSSKLYKSDQPEPEPDKGEGKSDEAVDAEFKEVDEEKDKS